MRFALLMLAFASAAAAQDFRVYTTVREGEGDGGPVLSRSLTLFHAGKTYDHIEAVGEVVIGEPAHRRFTLLRGGSVACRVSFDEVRQFRRAGASETKAYAGELAADPEQAGAAAALMFQLEPRFAVAERAGGLTMTSPTWSYDVDAAAAVSPGHAAAYLSYADRAANLNYVLHPQSFFPAAREALDEELSARGVVPTRVGLSVDVGRPLRLTAEHRFDWTLHAFDRTQIQTWERTAESPDLEWVSFREYQTRLVARQ